jgi:diadenosine tetraphosphatase ApaH/serine/threonine PP2A family protein phosphatase
MDFQERFRGRIQRLDGKQEPTLQRPVDKAVKAYKLHNDNPVSPLKTSAVQITRPLTYRSDLVHTPEKQTIRSVQGKRSPWSRSPQEAPFQLVASNSMGLGQPVDFSCLEDWSGRRPMRAHTKTDASSGWHYGELTPATTGKFLPDHRRQLPSPASTKMRARRFRSLSEEFY